MSGLRLGIETNSQEIATRFRRLVDRTRDNATPNKALAVELFRDVQFNFRTEGGLFGDPWEPLAPSTAEQKARLGYSPLPLVRTGFLRNTAWSDSDGSSVSVGYLADYASYHDDTDDKYIPSARLPRRRLLPPLAFAYAEGVRVYEWYINKSVVEVGLQ